MKHQHIQIQRSYPGFSQRNLCVRMLPKTWVLSGRTGGSCFEAELNNDDVYIRPWYNETQVQ